MAYYITSPHPIREKETPWQFIERSIWSWKEEKVLIVCTRKEIELWTKEEPQNRRLYGLVLCDEIFFPLFFKALKSFVAAAHKTHKNKK